MSQSPIFVFLVFSLCASISLLLVALTMGLNSSSQNKLQQKSEFECGFSSLSESKPPFNNQFFMVAMIFLVFDMEIILLVPASESVKSTSSSLVLFSILISLTLSLLAEWASGLTDWSKSQVKLYKLEDS